MQRIFITGANRGIGLELARQTLLRGDRIFAATRQPENAIDLQELKAAHGDQLTIIKLEVTEQAEIDAAVEQVSKEVDGLDVLINNAGILPPSQQPGNLEADVLLNTLRVNAVAPVMVTQALLALLRQGSDTRIVNVTSQLGSLALKKSGGRYSYNGSKAALNMYTKALAYDLQGDGITTIMIHPGWVATDMGGSAAPVSPAESAAGILQVTDGLTSQDNARFLGWDGSELPW